VSAACGTAASSRDCGDVDSGVTGKAASALACRVIGNGSVWARLSDAPVSVLDIAVTTVASLEGLGGVLWRDTMRSDEVF
jgi:hypothetical protein